MFSPRTDASRLKARLASLGAAAGGALDAALRPVEESVHPSLDAALRAVEEGFHHQLGSELAAPPHRAPVRIQRRRRPGGVPGPAQVCLTPLPRPAHQPGVRPAERKPARAPHC